MKPTISVTNKKPIVSFRIASLMLALTPLWLMLIAANSSAQAQTTSSPADWTELHRDNMQRWNPYETVLGVENIGSVQLKWRNTTGLINSSLSFESSPAVADGVVYIGSVDGKVYALDDSSGAVLWSFTATLADTPDPNLSNNTATVSMTVQ